MKKISILLTASAFMFLSFSVSAEVVTNTNCGSNCSWSYDTDTGEVNVFLTNTSGDNPTGTVSSTPWTTAYKSSITKITTDDLLSGNVKCNSCSNLTEVVLGKNVTSITSDAFRDTQLTSIVIPSDSKLTTISNRAFWGTKIESIAIPNSVTTINGNAFYGVSLSAITCSEENLARYIATGGVFKDGATISCSRGSCENALKGTKWEGKVGVIYPIEEKPLANGGVAVFKNGEFVGYKGKRIYTLEEANTVTGIKNRVVIRYK